MAYLLVYIPVVVEGGRDLRSVSMEQVLLFVRILPEPGTKQYSREMTSQKQINQGNIVHLAVNVEGCRRLRIRPMIQQGRPFHVMTIDLNDRRPESPLIGRYLEEPRNV